VPHNTAKLPSIRSQIALLVLACALPSVLGLGVLLQHFYQREQLQFQHEALATARALATAIGYDIGEAEIAALALASSPSLERGDLAGFAAQAASQLRPALPVQRLLLSDTAGRVLLTVGPAEPAAASPPPQAGAASPGNAAQAAQAARVAPAIAQGRPALSVLPRSDLPYQPEVAVDVPVQRGGKTLHVLTAVLKPNRLAEAAEAQRLSPQWLIALIGADGVIVDRNKEPERFVGTQISAQSREVLQGSGEGARLTESRDGTSVFAGLSLLPGRQWAVGVGMPEQQAMLDAALPSVPLVAGAVSMLLLVGIVLAWLMGGQIARSIASLTGPARALAGGETMALPHMTFREADEVAQALVQVEGDIQRHRHELQTLVAERTAQLEASKALLENVYASAPVGLSFVDMDLRIVMINDYLAAINDKPVSEHIGRYFSDVIRDAQVRLDVERDYRQVLATGLAVSGVEMSGTAPDHPDRAAHWLSSYFPVHDATGRMIGITGLLVDISPQKNIERQLRQSKQLFKQVVENMPAMLFVKRAADLRFEMMNRQAELTLGRPRTQFLGKNDFDFFLPEQADAFARADRTVLASNEVVEIAEEEVTAADGTVRVLNTRKVALRDEQGTPTHLLGMAIDITERKRADEVLRATSLSLARSNAFIRTVTDHVPAMVTYWDQELRCRFANRSFVEFMGLGIDQVIGAPLVEVIGGELYRRNRQRVEAALAGQPQSFYQDRPDRSGESHFVWANYIPDLDEAGKVRGFFVMVSDVTELKRTELRLHDLNEQLVRARDRAEAASRAKSAFVANMSHEIRTPMNAIIGLARLLEEAPLERRERSYVGKIQLATQSLLAVVNDVLDFSKIEAGQLKLEHSPFNLDHILTSIGVLVGQNAWNKGVEPVFNVAPDVPLDLVGDAMRLQQVLLNLAGNAVKFTEHGEVVVSVRQLASSATSTTLEFAVRDTGIGISPAQQAHLFEAFSQGDNSTSRQYGGTGLGLAICRRLVDLMNSSISLHSELGKGSTFRFACTLERAVHGLPAARELPPAVEGLSLLIVEDNATVLDMLTRQCQALGWRVWSADSGQAGLAQLRKLARAGAARQLDLLLLDAGLPDLDGISLLTQAHTDDTLQLPPTIMMAPDHYTEELIPIADSLHIATILAKPTTPSRLLASVVAVRTGTAHQSALPAHTPLSGRLAGMRVLLVEDNEINQEMAQYILLHAGARVDIACNGSVAVELLKADPERYDAVLMDLQMPVMNGYEATATLRAMGLKELPIIAMTANALDEDRQLAVEAGVNAHVPKPIDVDELLATLLRLAPLHPGRAAPDESWRQAPDDDRPTSLPGIDLEAALKRLAGNYPAFVGLLKRFENSQGGTVGEVRILLASGKQHAAAQLLHRLRGVAANLGAGDIARLSAQAEVALHEGSETDLAFLLTALDQSISVVTEAARTLPLPLPAAAADSGPAAGGADLPQALADLLCLLQTNNMKALTHFQALRPALEQHGHDAVLALAHAVETLDFTAAEHLVQDMLKRKDTA
jgi:PAS domain S-box-containing protein